MLNIVQGSYFDGTDRTLHEGLRPVQAARLLRSYGVRRLKPTTDDHMFWLSGRAAKGSITGRRKLELWPVGPDGSTYSFPHRLSKAQKYHLRFEEPFE